MMLVIGKASYQKGAQRETAEKLRCALIMRYLGETGEDVLFRDANGRPSLRIPQTDISTSHSNGMVFVALCVPDGKVPEERLPLPDWVQVEEYEGDFSRIGIDIEPLKRADRQRCQKIADRWFFREESDYLGAIDKEENYQEAFTRMWTQKESVCKMTGKGLSMIQTVNTMDPAKGIWLTSSLVETEKGMYVCSICGESAFETQV